MTAPAHGRFLFFADDEGAQATSALLNSSLFYVYFVAYGDCFHVNDGMVRGLPLAHGLLGDRNLHDLNNRLMADLRQNATTTTIRTRDGDTIAYAEYFASESKTIIDEIDRVLAKHYGFTDEELDFIINYDIKYRMGRDGDNGDA